MKYRVVYIGITDYADIDELNKIASDAKSVSNVSDFAALATHTGHITEEACRPCEC